jgi:hypothetical protein
MRAWLGALIVSVVLGCSGAGLTPVQTAQVVTSATAAVLDLVAVILAQVSAAAADQAKACRDAPDACGLADPTADPAATDP